MLRHVGLSVCLVLVPALAWAQNEAEQLLPASTQIYIRYDGLAAHRAAYEKTALGKMMQGDTGKFIRSVITQVEQNLSGLLTAQELLQGVPPERLKQLQTQAAGAMKLLTQIGEHGLVVGMEVRSVQPPQAQLTLILPNSGDHPEHLFGLIQLGLSAAKAEATEQKSDGRTLYTINIGPASAAWWVEGKHVVVTAGAGPADSLVERLRSKEDRLASSPAFRKMLSFKKFETAARAHVDFSDLLKVASTAHPLVPRIAQAVGFDGMKSLTMYSGFEGPAERGLVEVEVGPGPHKGLMSLVETKPFTLQDLPAVPPDFGFLSMTNFDLKRLYDEGTASAEAVLGMVAPEHVATMKDALKRADDELGIDLRKDLIDSLGEQFAAYSSPSEGLLSFGQVLLFKVRDEKKLEQTLAQLLKSFGRLTSVEASVRKRDYHGVTLHEVSFRQPGLFYVPTYAIHKGWLVVAYYPQPVQGYVLRAKGELPAWKADGQLKATLAKVPKEITAITVTDPRPMVQLLLEIAPIVAGAANSFLPDLKLEVGMLPNPIEATRHLFPNVSVGYKEGNVIRLETWASLAFLGS